MAGGALDKGPDAFRTISEVAEDLDLPQHVLRFWETRFPAIRPLKRGGGRRYYRPEDVDLLKGIRHLLYGEGYTIRGVQRILKEEGVRFVQAVGRGEQAVAPSRPEAGDGDDSLSAEADSTQDIGLAPPRAAEGRPVEADWDILHAALDELLECDRVLSTLRTPPEAGVNE
ncbi:MerR family transcriptional regulator [Microvirga thermotolerans]|uniref:MerR family transcriptional regulator n=1 Tax=Microvirga thermotolerans TaxID=2651334 RepID=A0A5P9JUS9_9HYPH|nr:MerR family transcriptional regulator [Microvirga thermotolerans]QFU16582.1 MerR family transcriptional regulator [Microvirga thermotolerans]